MAAHRGVTLLRREQVTPRLHRPLGVEWITEPLPRLAQDPHPEANVPALVEQDPLGELASEGALPLALDAAFDQMALVTRWAAEHAPQLQTISVHAHAYNNAGANAVQVGDQVRATLQELSERFPQDLTYEVFFDTTLFVTE